MRGPWIVVVAAGVLVGSAAGQEKKKYVGELLTILEKTHSPDAFLVTLTRLRDAGAGPHLVIPCAIRNAERLGIFEAHLFNEGDPKAGRASAVAAVITE